MYYNNLGNTGIKVSQIGLGTEYLFYQPKKIVIEVIQEAIEAGINYYDILFSVQHYLENLADAFKGYREKIDGFMGIALPGLVLAGMLLPATTGNYLDI